MLTFGDRAAAPSHVLVRFLDQESVLLNLETEKYFGLDETGTRMWQLVTTAPNINAAYQELLAEYDVHPELLRENLTELVGHLVEHGLLQVSPADVSEPEAARLPLDAIDTAENSSPLDAANGFSFLEQASRFDRAYSQRRGPAWAGSPILPRKIADIVVAARAAGNNLSPAHRNSQRKR